MEKFHLIGIKGTGMSALASILYDLGCEVTGSDVEEDFFTSKKLKEKEIPISVFDRANITDDRIYIASSCYKDENPEVNEVKKRNLPFYYYHQFIEHYFRNPKIGVSGAHGKTTTTSMIAKFFEDKDIAYLIGDGTGAGKKDYRYFIFEACEYKDHFLNYTYDYLVINNIDHDHPDYFKTVDDVLDSFQKAAARAEHLIINNDNELCRKINHPHKTTFGMGEADISGKIMEEHPNGYMVEVSIFGTAHQYYLPFPGLHMIYNFLGSLAVCVLNGIDPDTIQGKLLSYRRPSRRMEEYFYYDNVLIDDYAHHPTEIRMCINAIRQKYPTKDLVIIFQPHTYSRTLGLQDEFREVLGNEKLYIEKTFTSKREEADKNLEAQVLSVFPNAKPFHRNQIKLLKELHNTVILFLGAGTVDKYITEIIQ